MIKLFRNSHEIDTIRNWSMMVHNRINENENLKIRIDQVGIFDAYQIISDYLEHNESGLAYEHLVYVIQESGIYLDQSETDKISKMASKFGIKTPDLNSSNDIENKEFYRILDIFNSFQIQVVEKLIQVWGMPRHINGSKWFDWSQSQHEKHSFKNESGTIIFPHGYGLRYKDREFDIDFDFGENGEINGFDASRLWLLIESNKLKTLFTSIKHIDKVIKTELPKGRIRFGGYINYYKV